MTESRLKLNAYKTEFLIIGTHKQRDKFKVCSYTFRKPQCQTSSLRTEFVILKMTTVSIVCRIFLKGVIVKVKLVKDQCRLDIRKHSFSQRTINEWNKLSTYCVTASSVNMFKNKVDTYLRRAGYK